VIQRLGNGENADPAGKFPNDLEMAQDEAALFQQAG
jgi:hypothetical protein